MKPISITCIIAGVFVFVSPMLYQFGAFALCAYALANTHLATLNLSAPALEGVYSAASVMLGLLLTGAGVFFGVTGRRDPKSDPTRQNPAPPLAQASDA